MNPNITILIVDDTNVNILKAEYILKNEGFNTLTANSGQACLKTLLTHSVDLILLDIEMPGMDGFETLDAIRSNPDTADIPVIFVTADKSSDAVLKAIEQHIVGYITKPFDEEELLDHVVKVFFPGSME